MLEVLKSKMMVGVAVLLLGIVFINSGISNKLEENANDAYDKVIAMNIQ